MVGRELAALEFCIPIIPGRQTRRPHIKKCKHATTGSSKLKMSVRPACQCQTGLVLFSAPNALNFVLGFLFLYGPLNENPAAAGKGKYLAMIALTTPFCGVLTGPSFLPLSLRHQPHFLWPDLTADYIVQWGGRFATKLPLMMPPNLRKYCTYKRLVIQLRRFTLSPGILRHSISRASRQGGSRIPTVGNGIIAAVMCD